MKKCKFCEEMFEKEELDELEDGSFICKECKDPNNWEAPFYSF